MEGQLEYKFVRMRLKAGLWSSEIKPDYQEVVHQHAAAGWRLVQVFAPTVLGYGAAKYADLIFERPKE
jgi:hypothetical protein